MGDKVTALNLLDLSTQVPGRYIYISDGPTRSYKVKNTTIEFNNSALKDTGFKYSESKVIVSALKSLGKERVTEQVVAKIKKQVDPEMYKKIITDTKTATVWIYETIKKICSSHG